MNGEAVENMVLRTVYLPPAVDRRLKEIAFTKNITKAELIRQYVNAGLNAHEKSEERTLAERLDGRAAAVAAARGAETELDEASCEEQAA